MAVWTLLLPLLKYLVPLPFLVQITWARARDRERSPDRLQRVVALASWVCRICMFGEDVNCLVRSLVLYRFLSEANEHPHLLIGMRKTREGYLGHAWVTVEGKPVGDPLAIQSEFLPVVAFGDDGRRYIP